MKNTSTRKWNKPTLQSVLKQMRKMIKEGAPIKIESNPNEMLRYSIYLNCKVVLTALNGRFDYLVTFDNRLFTKTN